MTTLADLAGPIDEDLPPLDRLDTGTDGTSAEWVTDGVMHLPGLIPDAVVDAYCGRFITDAAARAGAGGRSRDALRDYFAELGHGYGIGTPYLHVPELRDVALHRDLAAVLEAILGEPAGMHLNLTGWKSTQRAWHQDRYLNPPCVGNWYIAAWIALDDIDPDAGPFEYVPGSHRWPSIDQARMLAVMGEDGSDPDWPWRSEAILGPLFAAETVARGGHVAQFIAKKGDVLLWHPNLCHRGSIPRDSLLARRALIVHYSALSRRCDMRGRERRWQSAAADGWFFALGAVR